MAIHFFNEDIEYKLPDQKATIKWVDAMLINEGYSAENINYVVCSDDHLLQINKEYLDHDTYTDIVTFDNSENAKEIEADIFISIDRIRENAIKLSRPEDEELHRVIIHGLLHIMGYSDKTDQNKQAMREKEDACLSLR